MGSGARGEIEPYASGRLDVGAGNFVYWETCGNPRGQAAVVLHGGPGSGCSPWHRGLFDPAAFRVVLFDERGCGRSTPLAAFPETELATNTTWHLVDDMERLRRHLAIERWLLLGGSWGSTLALAYAQAYPEHVSGAVLFGVTTGRRREFDWWFRGGAAAFLPEQWERLVAGVGPSREGGDVVDAYRRILDDPDPDVRDRAARDWCLWESASPGEPPGVLASRFEDPIYRQTYARLVTHYVRHDGFVDDGQLLDGARGLAAVPATLVHGALDVQAPLENAWTLARAWPGAELVVVADAAHDAPADAMTNALVRAIARYE